MGYPMAGHLSQNNDIDLFVYNRSTKVTDKWLKEHEGYVQIKKFWKDHTKAIRQFYRYPHRNKILGRVSTEEELTFLNKPNSSW